MHSFVHLPHLWALEALVDSSDFEMSVNGDVGVPAFAIPGVMEFLLGYPSKTLRKTTLKQIVDSNGNTYVAWVAHQSEVPFHLC